MSSAFLAHKASLQFNFLKKNVELNNSLELEKESDLKSGFNMAVASTNNKTPKLSRLKMPFASFDDHSTNFHSF